MSLTIACPCGQHYSVAEEYAGQQVSCTVCGKLLTVPAEIAPEEDGPPIVVACPSCRQHFSVPAQYGGMRTPCPTCTQPLDIPTFAEAGWSAAAPCRRGRDGRRSW